MASSEPATSSESVVPPEPATSPESVAPLEPATSPESVVPLEPATSPESVVPPEPATSPESVAPLEPATSPESVAPPEPPASPEEDQKGIEDSHASETPQAYHRHLSEGIVHLNQNNLEEALAQFQQALAEDQEGVEAHYYIGVTEARANRPEEAKQKFQEVLARHPEFLPARFDLGVLYYQRGEDEKALEAFEVVQRADPGRARVYYYQGQILLRTGRAKEAAPKMEKAASLDSSLAPDALVQAGTAHYEAGDLDMAKKALETARAHTPAGQDTTELETSITQIQQQVVEKQKLHAAFLIGVQYDTNILLVPDQTAPSFTGSTMDKDGGRSMITASGQYRWLDRSPWIGRAKYSFYQSLHWDGGLSEFNLQNHHITLEGERRKQNARHNAVLSYDLQFVALKSDRFLTWNQMGPRTLFKTQGGVTELRYQFGAKNFSNVPPFFPRNSSRDVQTHKIGATHHIQRSMKTQKRLYAGYDLEREIAGTLPDQDDWTFTGHRLRGGVTLPLRWKSLFATDAEYLIRRFDHPNEQSSGKKRRDSGVTAILTLSRPITESAEATFQYRYQQNGSNISFFDHQRYIYGAGMTLRFP